MKTLLDLLVVLGLILGIAGCDSGAATAPSGTEVSIIPGEREVAESESIDSLAIYERLFVDLNQRETWPSNGVKIWLANPTVSITTLGPDDRPTVIHAWPKNQNDFHVAMMRLNQGETLYAITDEDFHLLDEWQQIPVLTTPDELDAYIGQLVTVRGEVFNSKIPTICGVDVQSSTPDLRGEYAEATGILQRIEVTPEQIANANYANRGAGTFYRLKDRDSNYEAQVRRAVLPTKHFGTCERLDSEGRWRSLDPTDGKIIRLCLRDVDSFKHWGHDIPPHILATPVPTTVGVRLTDKSGKTTVHYFSRQGGLVGWDNGLLEVPEKEQKMLAKLFAEWRKVDSERIASQSLPCEYQVGLAEDEMTLSGIARLFYSDASKWRDIYEANKDVIENPNVIRPGMKITIPKVD